MKHRYNYDKLRGKIKEIVGSESKYAELLGLSNASISAKLNSLVPFSITEIDKSVTILNIPTNEIYEYFFSKESWKKINNFNHKQRRKKLMKLKEMNRIPIQNVAELLNCSPQFVRIGLQQQRLPIGTAVKMSSTWTYHVSYELLKNYVGEQKIIEYEKMKGEIVWES